MYFDQVLNQIRIEPDGTMSELRYVNGERRFDALREVDAK